MKSNIYINIILAGLIILGILYVIGGYKEGFHTREACGQNLLSRPLLAPPFGDYKQTDNKCALSNYNHESTLSLAAKSNLADYSQVTNNKRYWSTPCNGAIMLPEMCGGLYKRKKIIAPAQVSPPNDTGVRVNYFDSSSN